MKKLPIILTLLLTFAWAYTCWYWYTCNIKGFCDEGASYSVNQTEDNMNSHQQGTGEKTSIKAQENVISEDIESAPKLSAKDVLFDPLPKEIEQEEEIQDIEGKDEEITQSGSVIEETSEVNNEKEEKDEEINSQATTICETPLVGPIVLGGKNNRAEVEKLEAFLILRGESVSIDGKYGNDDLEAIKRFQLEYKSEVLDPWGITSPTGYVGRTSIAKINELACK